MTEPLRPVGLVQIRVGVRADPSEPSLEEQREMLEGRTINRRCRILVVLRMVFGSGSCGTMGTCGLQLPHGASNLRCRCGGGEEDCCRRHAPGRRRESPRWAAWYQSLLLDEQFVRDGASALVSHPARGLPVALRDPARSPDD